MTRTTWQTVPTVPDGSMSIAFAAEIRRQAGLLPPGTTAHEPLAPLWAAVLAVAPSPPARIAVPSTMPRNAAEGWNAAIAAMVEIAARSAERIASTSARRVHEDFAVAALSELAEAGRALLIAVEPASVASRVEAGR